jgi:hypothetical protein
MSAGKRPPQPKRLSYLVEEEPNSKHVRAPEPNACYSFVEAVSPAFYPNMVLLRRGFIRQDKVKYVSVGYYSTKDFNPSWNSWRKEGASDTKRTTRADNVRTSATPV